MPPRRVIDEDASETEEEHGPGSGPGVLQSVDTGDPQGNQGTRGDHPDAPLARQWLGSGLKPDEPMYLPQPVGVPAGTTPDDQPPPGLLGKPDQQQSEAPKSGRIEDEHNMGEGKNYQHPDAAFNPWMMTHMPMATPFPVSPAAQLEAWGDACSALAKQYRDYERGAWNPGFPPPFPGMWQAFAGSPDAYLGMQQAGYPARGQRKGGGKGDAAMKGGKGGGRGGKNSAKSSQTQAASSIQAGLGKQNGADGSAAAGPKAWTWSAEVKEEFAKPRRRFLDAIVFQLALDKNRTRRYDADVHSIPKKTLTDEVEEDIDNGSIKALKLDKIWTESGKEKTIEEYTRDVEAARRAGPKPAPEGTVMSRDDLKLNLKVQGGEGKEERSFEELTLFSCKLRTKDKKEMQFVEFVYLPEKEREACFPIQVYVPQCSKQALKTTVMIRNLPNSYERKDVAKLLDDQGFRCQYDFIYVPADYKNKHGLGYAFVNMGNSKPDSPRTKRNVEFHTWATNVWEKLEGFKGWKEIDGKKSSKACEVTWGSSEHQGKEHHIERYRNSPVMHKGNDDKYKPAIYDDEGNMKTFPPPENGKSLRKPRTKKTARTGCKSPPISDDEEPS